MELAGVKPFLKELGDSLTVTSPDPPFRTFLKLQYLQSL